MKEKFCSCFLGSLILLFFFSTSYGQKAPVKWGKVSEEDLQLKECEFEKDANAVILNDYGTVEFDRNNVIINRHVRIKILNQEGLEWADVRIPYYAEDRFELVNSVKAQTINSDENGKLYKISVEGKEIFEVDKDKNWKEKRFTFPSVKVGSILEYSYTTVSKSVMYLDAWIFQNSIPTLHSEFRANIPSGLDYRVIFQGNRLLFKYGKVNTNRWVLENVPSLKEEPFVANHWDYQELIRFQLAGYKKTKSRYGGGIEYVNLMTSWEALAKEVVTDESYAPYFNRKAKAKEFLFSTISEDMAPREKAEKIFYLVTNTFKWNELLRRFPTQSFNKFLESKTGNGTEINLFLNLLLNAAGLNASPLLLSTRSNGKIYKGYPLLSQFNHVIVELRLGEETILLDATEPLVAFGQLPDYDLNGFGYRLDRKAPDWVEIKPSIKTSSVVFVQADLSAGSTQFEITLRFSGYDALDLRRDLIKTNQELISLIGIDEDVFEVVDDSVRNLEDPTKPLQVNLTLALPEEELVGDMIYLPAIFVNFFSENPFKSEKRYYPVDFGKTFKDRYTLTLKLPKEIEVEEIPKSARVKLPGDAGQMSFYAKVNGNVVSITSTVSMDQAIIPEAYYPYLKEFFGQIVGKYTEHMVLKRKEIN
ncbi:DUF3857 domain-containing protein [Xanthovirga aplysinae]|uniref:DUF3857 domain-containing protein n=1 Tax=Xanthovirga aplysinae TaxID=2529853 RepID=UPI0012BC9074|nr:DUF3857 domain-containing protein [Xanthovirga aplysinae]MTI31631.1 DUF3857 domain-containing protein [Xanthovirga aplysinae]